MRIRVDPCDPCCVIRVIECWLWLSVGVWLSVGYTYVLYVGYTYVLCGQPQLALHRRQELRGEGLELSITQTCNTTTENYSKTQI